MYIASYNVPTAREINMKSLIYITLWGLFYMLPPKEQYILYKIKIGACEAKINLKF